MTMEGATARTGGMNGGQGEQLRHAATGLADQAARTAEAQASTTMTKAGETLEQVARAIRQAGDGLREQQPEIAGFVDTAATRVEEASSYLREHDAAEALGSVQDFARRQPAMVIGGGLALGLLLGRFLRSGASGAQGAQGGYGMSGPTGRGPAGGARYAAGGYGSGGYGTSYGADTYGGATATPGYSPAGETTAGMGGGMAEGAGHGTALRDTAEPEDIDRTLSPAERLGGEAMDDERGR